MIPRALHPLFALLLALPALSALFAPAAHAQAPQQRISVRVALAEDAVYAGVPFDLQVIIDGADSAELPDLAQIPNLAALSPVNQGGQSASQSSVTIINGRRSETNILRYFFTVRLTAPEPGTLQIPAIPVTVEGRTYLSDPGQIEVQSPQATDDYRVWLEVDKQSLFVGEPTRLRIVWLVGRENTRNPQIILPPSPMFEVSNPPEELLRSAARGRAFIGVWLNGREAAAYRDEVELDGRRWVQVVTELLLVPRAAGEITVGPVTVACEVATGRRRSSFFDSPFFDNTVTTRFAVSSGPLKLDVKPVPEFGRPSNFDGLVGEYSLAASAEPASVNVGDPITLKIQVTGPPPIDRVPAPRLEDSSEFDAAFRVGADDTPPQSTATTRTWTHQIRPRAADVTQIPAIELPYFDVTKGEYAVARTKPIPLEVRSTREVTVADAQGAAASPLAGPVSAELESRAGGLAANFETPAALVNQRFSLGSTLASPAGLAALLAPPAVCAACAVAALRRKSGGAAGRARRRRRALADARAALDAGPDAPAAVARAVAVYMSARLDNAPAAPTAADCERLLTPLADADALRDLAAALRRSDAARFGGLAGAEADRLRADAAAALERVDQSFGRTR